MARTPVFYSFHFANDVFRVQQVRNIGVIEGNEPVSPNDWEAIKKKGDAAVEKWIEDNMAYKRCVIVLVGTETSSRKWVDYEILKAWRDKRGLFGIHIHSLKCPKAGTCAKGVNPFTTFNVGSQKLSDFVNCYDPNPLDAYNDISKNMAVWVQRAIDKAEARKN